jgi:hypothetical protein
MKHLGGELALPLLVAGVGANHTNDALAFDDLAILAKLLNGRANFHIQILSFYTIMRPTDRS